MENKYLKIVSKKDFDFDEFMQAYLSKHHNNKDYLSYMLSVFEYKGDNNGWHKSLIENNINHDGNK